MKNLRLYWPAWLAAAVVLIATAAVAVYVERSVEATDRARNQRELDRLQLVTEEKMRMYTTLVASTAALFAARPDITREEFATFTARFRTEPDAYAGVLGVAFSRRLQQEEVEEFVASMRAGPFPDFEIRPSDPRAEVHAIQYIEPMNRRNAVAIGYDMFTHPVRRAAMERARDTGLPALSDRVTLVQEIEPRSTSTSRPSIWSGCWPRPRVMLVEDDDESRVVIASILQHHGASVTALSSVCEALGRIDTAFDLVLTDIGMPESDGYALLRGIRERGVTVPVVALTAYGSPDDTMRIAAAGFQGHLVKPVTRDHLIDTAAAAARGLTA